MDRPVVPGYNVASEGTGAAMNRPLQPLKAAFPGADGTDADL